MFSSKLLFVAALICSASAAPTPLSKRIAQVISDSTTKWEAACDAAGGGQQCNPTAVAAFGTLLAAAGPCDQQNAADNMIDLAKTLQNNAQVISLAQIFAQQPRNSPTSDSVVYCQQAPKNPELNGLFQCQFQSTNTKTFISPSGPIPAGSPGTIPLGQSSPLSPPGSCPANPGGPIADGSQLVDVTTNPGTPGSSSSSASSSSNNAAGSSAAAPAPSSSSDDGSDSDDSTPAPSSAAAPAPADSTPAASSSGSGGFKEANGEAAQKLNAQFATLTADSSCTAGQNACVNGQFAQCVNGSFELTPCAGGLTCQALPLVNSPGTSITCDTVADATQRIATSGAQGGLTGSN